MAVSLFSFKKTPTSKVTSFVDPTKFGGAFSGAKRSTLKSEAAEKATALKEVKELSYIRKALETLVTLEKRHFDMVGESIKKFALSEEKRQAKEEEASQENKKDGDKNKDETKNPLVKEGQRRLEGIAEFLQKMMKLFIGYKILEWAGKPENAKKIQNIINFFSRLFKFIGVIGKGIAFAFGASPIGIVLNNLPKAFDLVIKVVGGIVDFLSFKWLGESVQGVGKLISDSINVLKSIPDAIGSLVSFVTNLIPNFIESVLTQGLNGTKDQLESEVNSPSVEPAKAEVAPSGGEESKSEGIDFGKMFGDSLKNVASTVLQNVIPGGNLIASVGKGISGLFGKKDEELPKLAKGGIVTKPTEAIVGEAGPEAILPLDKLGSFGVDEFKGQVDKQIPSFIKLLTLPFKIVGAGIVALISSSVSRIPGIGPILMPLISNVASMFGIPPSLVKGMSNFASAAIKSVGDGMSAVKEVFGIEEPKVTKSKADEFKPSGDTSVRGLLGDILSALISKNSKSSSDNPQSTTPPSTTPSTTPSTEPSANPTKVGGSTKPMQENANLAKAGDSKVQNVAGTRRDLEKKGFNYIVNTANRFWQDSQGRLYEATTTRNNTSLATMMGVGDPVYKLKAVTEDQINKGFTAAGSERTVGSRNNQEIQRQLELFRIINKGGTLEKETTGSKTQVKQDAKWIDKGGPIRGSGIGDKISILAEPGEYMLNKNATKAMGGPAALDKINHGLFPRFGGGPVATRKFLKLGGGWAPVPEDSSGVVLGRGLEHGYVARDLPMPVGTPLLSPFDGKVHEINKNSGGWGNYIVLKSNSGLFSLFGHVSSYTKKKGDTIKTGEQVASSGHQHGGGRSTGPHLHWEIGNSWNGTIGGKVEPIAWTKGKATPSVTGQTTSTASTDTSNADQNNTPEPTWSSIVPQLTKLTEMLTGAPSKTHGPESTDTAKAQPLKVVPSTSPRSQSLQSAQRENNNIQAQRRTAGNAGPNIVTLPTQPQTISEANSRPLAQPLGGTTPPIPLATYPLAP